MGAQLTQPREGRLARVWRTEGVGGLWRALRRRVSSETLIVVERDVHGAIPEAEGELPEGAFYRVAAIEAAVAKAQKMDEEAA